MTEELTKNIIDEVSGDGIQLNLSIPRDSFLQALQKLNPITERRSTMPILSTILIEAEDDTTVKLSATDLFISYTISIPAEVKFKGSVCITAKTLYDIVRLLPEDTINLIVEKNWWVHISCGKVNYKIPGIGAEDFPVISDTEGEEFFQLKPEILRYLASKVSFSMYPDDDRPMINGALLEIEGDRIKMVSTDGHRLTVCWLEEEGREGPQNLSALLPYKSVHQMQKFLESDSTLSIGITEKFLYLNITPISEDSPVKEQLIAIKLVEESFPPYSNVIPPEGDKVMFIPREDFIKSLKRISLVATDRAYGVKLTMKPDTLILQCESPELGTATEEISINYDGEEMIQVFNYKYLLDVLQVMEDEEVRIEFSEPLNPWIVTPPSGRQGFMCIIMPMKL